MKRIISTLLMLLALGAIVGCSDVGNSGAGADTVVATVNDVKIMHSDIERMVKKTQFEMTQQGFGEMATASGREQNYADMLEYRVQSEVLIQQAKAQGFLPDEDGARQYIEETKADLAEIRQDEGHRETVEAFEKLIADMDMTEDEFWDYMVEDAIQQDYISRGYDIMMEELNVDNTGIGTNVLDLLELMSGEHDYVSPVPGYVDALIKDGKYAVTYY